MAVQRLNIFPDNLDEEVWEYVTENEMYLVSQSGLIYNNVTDKLLRHSYSSRGDLKVGLIIEGIQVSKLIKNLVASAFLEGRDDIFDTVIQKDGDKTNVHISNLTYRPRWFAMKYTHQFLDTTQSNTMGPVMDISTGVTYENVYTAAVENGLLFSHIIDSILHGCKVFPTHQRFVIFG